MRKGSLSGLDFLKGPPEPAMMPPEVTFVSVVHDAARGHDEALDQGMYIVCASA